MRLLLDECVPKRFRRELPSHDVRTVQEAGWAGIQNGALLRAAEGHFDALLTVDQSVKHQQNLTGLRIGVVIMAAASNDIDDLRPLVPAVLESLDSLQPGEIKRVGRQGWSYTGQFKHEFDGLHWGRFMNSRCRAAWLGLFLILGVRCTLNAQSTATPGAESILRAADLQADVALLRRAYETLHPGLLRYNTPAQIGAAFSALELEFKQDRTLAQTYSGILGLRSQGEVRPHVSQLLQPDGVCCCRAIPSAPAPLLLPLAGRSHDRDPVLYG